MKCLNICIDIDGTITDPYYWLHHANDYFNLNVSKEDITQYDIAKTLNITREEYLKFYEEMKFKIHSEEKIREDVKPILDMLYIFHNLYFVTARDKSLELLTTQYLKTNNIPYDDVFVLGNCNKTPIAQKLNCDIFIEDSYDNALSLSASGFRVILLDTNYNRFPLTANITRVFNWHQILEILYNLSKKEEVV